MDRNDFIEQWRALADAAFPPDSAELENREMLLLAQSMVTLQPNLRHHMNHQARELEERAKQAPKSTTRIEDVVCPHVKNLRSVGRDVMKGDCPVCGVHGMFHVHIGRQFFYGFCCDAKGTADSFPLVMRRAGRELAPIA